MSDAPETIWVSEWHNGALGSDSIHAYASERHDSLHVTRYLRADLVDAEIERLLGELDESSAESLEQARLLAAGSEREARLMAEVERLRALVREASEWSDYGSEDAEYGIRHCCHTRDFEDHKADCAFRATLDGKR